MLVLAHRGAGWHDGTLKENSLESFKLAHKMGANGIETDVRITRDNKVVLFHDKSVDGRAVEDMRHSELDDAVGYRVLVLEELLNWVPKKFIVNLEIKTKAAVAKTSDTIKAFKHKNYIISSFWHTAASQVSKMCNTDFGLLMSCRPMIIGPFLQLLPVNTNYIIWDYDVYDPEFVSTLSRFQHLVYNAGDEEIDRADGVISDNIKLHLDQKRHYKRHRMKKVYK